MIKPKTPPIGVRPIRHAERRTGERADRGWTTRKSDNYGYDYNHDYDYDHDHHCHYKIITTSTAIIFPFQKHAFAFTPNSTCPNSFGRAKFEAFVPRDIWTFPSARIEAALRS